MHMHMHMHVWCNIVCNICALQKVRVCFSLYVCVYVQARATNGSVVYRCQWEMLYILCIQASVGVAFSMGNICGSVKVVMVYVCRPEQEWCQRWTS